jgi:hypothetical protein
VLPDTRRPWSLARGLRAALLALSASAVATCAAPPLGPTQIAEPALVSIHTAYVEAVDWARTNGAIDWRSGWSGNAVVHLTDDRTLGLCHEWQQLVWERVRPATLEAGWQIDGISANDGTWSVHRAVVVWDPAHLDRDDLLTAPTTAPAYVLDPWRRGEPDVYTVADWVDIPLLTFTDPRLEDLAADFGTTPRFKTTTPSRTE